VRLTWLLLSLVAFGLLLAGCTQNPPASSDAGKNTSPAAPVVTPPTPPVVPPTPPVDAKADLTRALSLMGSTAWRAEYSVDMGAASTTPITGMAMYRDGQGSFRYDLSTPQMDVRMYHPKTAAESAGVVCVKNSTINWTCVNSPSLSTDLFSTLGADLKNETVVPLQSKTVAGVSTSCYNVTDTKGQSDTLWGEVCFSSQGAMLFMQAVGKQDDGTLSTATFEATSYSATVSASDFVPPATPIDYPSGE
jgi:hypothetical protein